MFLCGIIFLVLGVVLLLTNLGVISGNVFNILLALLFIVIGLKCLFKKKSGHHWCCGQEHKPSGE